MANIFKMLTTQLTQRLSTNKGIENAFNRAFYRFVGNGYTNYNAESPTYLSKGYNLNSTVYAIIQQMSTKAANVPLFIQRVVNEAESKRFEYKCRNLNVENITAEKRIINNLRKKAFQVVDGDPDFLPPPLKKPNPHQTWTEFFSLSETFLRLTGNIYYYMPTQLFGSDSGQPFAIYILPSHLMQIVLKKNADLVLDSNPVSHYVLTEGAIYDEFQAEEVVHITYANPNYSQDGEHLYGQSPLKAALYNLETSNEANAQNIKTMKNSGVYGFIHGKQAPLQEPQARELKRRLKEMDDDPSRLSRIAGMSHEIGFTRISLTTDELRPFEFLNYSASEIANTLGWSVLLLNNVDGAKYDNLKQIRQRVVTDTLMPDLGLIQDAFNNEILTRFKGYEKSKCYFDFSLLPEMQNDLKETVDWLSIALRDGVVTRNEYREALSFPTMDEKEFDEFTVQMGVMPLSDALLDSGTDITITEEDEEEDEEIDEENED